MLVGRCALVAEHFRYLVADSRGRRAVISGVQALKDEPLS
jgi:hypothetical protein